ncbi:hypothetical protein GEO20_25540 [Rhodococcus erythropolis]|nr:hypothetical protein [Rhodococcus erythropolis]NRH35150.1 hypothetical protein [Rhodococcus sp. MS13]
MRNSQCRTGLVHLRSAPLVTRLQPRRPQGLVRCNQIDSHSCDATSHLQRCRYSPEPPLPKSRIRLSRQQTVDLMESVSSAPPAGPCDRIHRD